MMTCQACRMAVGVLEEKRQVTSYEVSHLIIMHIINGKAYRVRNTV